MSLIDQQWNSCAVDEAKFDETIHAPVRLRICGLLRPVDCLDFAVLRAPCSVTH